MLFLSPNLTKVRWAQKSGFCNEPKIDNISHCALNKFLKYIFQVVAGTNFFVKVHVGDDKHVHLRIYRDLQGHVFLHGHQVDKSHEDSIEYF